MKNQNDITSCCLLLKLYFSRPPGLLFLVTALMVFTSIINPLYAQSGYRISGRAVDENGIGLPAVSISIMSSPDSSIVQSGLSDTIGKFAMMIKSPGDFLLRISFLGYEKKYYGPFRFGNEEALDIGDIKLVPLAVGLTGLTVTAKKEVIENSANKTILNVQKSIVASGSSAFEMIKKLPGVQIDNNDNISIKGKNGFRVSIDGKLLPLDNANIAAYLKSISSNDIEAIELIADPGVKYDASGNAGIINIRLKKNRKNGFNTNISLGLIEGVTPKENAGIDLAYKNQKVNLFSSINGSIGTYQTNFYLHRVQLDSLYDERSLWHDKNKSFNVKTGADYALDNKQTLGFVVINDYSDNVHMTGGSTPIYYNPTGEYIKTLRSFSNVPGTRENADFNINYRKTDSAGTNISFDADYGLFRSRANGSLPSYYYNTSGGLLYSIIDSSKNPTNINIYTVKLDFEKKLGTTVIQYGGKVSFVNTTNSYSLVTDSAGKSTLVPGQSSDFDYNENINALYGNAALKLAENLNLQIGLRIEQTNSEGTLTYLAGSGSNAQPVNRHYIDAFPVATLSWPSGSKSNFALTIDRRIDRPTYQDLNPFEIKFDQLTYFRGNPMLKPQYTDNISLANTYDKLTTSIGFSYVTQLATRISDTAGNTQYGQPRNIGTQKSISFNAMYPISFAPWWSGNSSFWYSYQMFDTKIGQEKILLNTSLFGANLQQSFALGHDYSSELNGWIIGPSIFGPQWTIQTMGGLDLGVQKLVLSKQASIKLACTDLLNTSKMYVHSHVGGIVGDGSLITETRTIRLSFVWRFGSNKISNSAERKTGIENELKRIKPNTNQ